MTSANHVEDLNQGRGWLNRAAEMLDSCEDHRSDAEFARAAAAIGNGFIALAHAERAAVSAAETSQVRQAILSLSDEPTLAAAEREQRAEAEARPHDDAPEMTLGEALRHPLGHSVPGDGFRGFTRHGHPVGGEAPADRAGGSAARCGGLHGCAQCAADAARLRIPGRTEADLDD